MNQVDTANKTFPFSKPIAYAPQKGIQKDSLLQGKRNHALRSQMVNQKERDSRKDMINENSIEKPKKQKKPEYIFEGLRECYFKL